MHPESTEADSLLHKRFERVVARFDRHARLVRAHPLTGGVSARVTALELARPDGTAYRVVARQHGAADLQRNPNVARDEFRMLDGLKRAGLAVPEPLYVDLSREIFREPYLIIEFMEGKPDFNPRNLASYLEQAADHLHGIHMVRGTLLDALSLPTHDDRCSRLLARRPAVLDDSLSERLIRDTLETLWPLPQTNAPRLLHGDYWPGNLLWNDGTLAAILDWEDAATGSPLADLGNSRMEILWAFGEEAMRAFTEAYLTRATLEVGHLPVWDLFAALRPASRLSSWGLVPAVEQLMRERHGWFVAQAIASL